MSACAASRALRRWGLQLRLLAAVLAQHFKEASLTSKISWVKALNRKDSVEQLAATTMLGLNAVFAALQVRA